MPVKRKAEPKLTLGVLARRYILWMNQRAPDVEKALQNYGDEMLYEDLTRGIVAKGKTDFAKSFAEAVKNNTAREAKTEFTRLFISGNFAVISGVHSHKGKTEAERVRMRFVTVLETNAGLIARHTDLLESDELKP